MPLSLFSKNPFLGALVLERWFPTRARMQIARALAIALLLLGGLLIGNDIAGLEISFVEHYASPLFSLLLGARLVIFLLNSFARAKMTEKHGGVEATDLYRRLTWSAAALWYRASHGGKEISPKLFLAAIPRSDAGAALFARLGLSTAEWKHITRAASEAPISQERIAALPREVFGLGELIGFLFDNDNGFRAALETRGIGRATLVSTAAWGERESEEREREMRWWSRENLARIPGLAKDWAFGRAFTLEKFSRDLTDEALTLRRHLIGIDRELQMIESALLKKSGANALIVGEPGVGKTTLLLALTRHILLGAIFPELEHKRVWLLDAPALIATGKTKGEVEALLIQVLNESVRAGNVILAIDHFPEFVDSLAKVGVGAAEIFSPSLTGVAVHIIGLAEPIPFRRVLEENQELLRHFERIDMREPELPEILLILEDVAPEMEIEHRGHILFTYPALEKIAEGATRYLVSGHIYERAVDLLEKTVTEAREKGTVRITADLVLSVLRRETKMPLGEIDAGEQEKLLKLDGLLRARVVGQDVAVSAVADAIRRARAGVRNPKRPIGTFFFLGPTGVGKTETAKALAEVYFDSEEAMARFDMTEYQTEESMERLIGSFEAREPGLLASRIRTSPYTVVLLDEFEKSHAKIKNLFLQILDEGFFTDHQGEKINMRNTIIIATSNAGSQMIWDFVRQGKNPSDAKEEILEDIQRQGIMTPELLNRFDSIVIYRPLDPESLTKIARIMLEKLARRMREQHIILKITDELVDAVAKGGYDPARGARPMQRWIQDHIEKVIAEKIIKKEIVPGSEFAFTSDDISSL